MFVQHTVHLDHPVKACTDALMEGPPRWFLRSDAGRSSSVGLHVAGVPVRKRVVIELGQPVRTKTWTVIPLTWKATFPKKLFPEMTGRIELAPTDAKVTRLTVSGMYEPPLGRLGVQLDDAVMHNVAEGTVKELAESIADRLQKAIASRSAQDG